MMVRYHCLLLATISMVAACGTLYYGEPAPVVYVDSAPATDDAAGPLPGEDVPGVEVFYDELEHYGAWEHDEDYGYVFSPYDANYVPYSEGHWALTEYGLTWISTDPIGWAVTHYGRWLWRDRWLWVPDTAWGPAWVQWRVGEGEIGWAPLGVGERRSTMPYWGWRFVPRRKLMAKRLGDHYYRERRLHRSIRYSRPVHRWLESNGERYVAGPDHRGLRVRPQRLSQLPMRRVGRVHWSRQAAGATRGHALRSTRNYRAGPAPGSRFSRAGLAQEKPKRYRPKPRRYRRGERDAAR